MFLEIPFYIFVTNAYTIYSQWGKNRQTFEPIAKICVIFQFLFR